MLLLALALQTAASEELAIRAKIDVDAAGKITDCRVVKSEAPPNVNDSTCRTIMEKGRMKPETKKGEAIASTREITIRWRPEAAPPPAAAAPVGR